MKIFLFVVLVCLIQFNYQLSISKQDITSEKKSIENNEKRQILNNTSDESIPIDQSPEIVKKSSAERELVENNKLRV